MKNRVRAKDLGWAWKPGPGERSVYELREQSRKTKRKRNKRKRRNELLYAPGEVFYESKPWKRLRRQVLEKYGYKCMRCDAVDTEIHVDHISPRSKRPDLSLTFKNLQVLCRDCNMEKWNYHSHDYREESITRDIELRIAREANARI